jgi:hypothetical protein
VVEQTLPKVPLCSPFSLPPALTLARVIVANDAVPLLLSTGFELKEAPPGADERVVTFSREDSALLYMVLSIIDTALAAMEPSSLVS